MQRREQSLDIKDQLGTYYSFLSKLHKNRKIRMPDLYSSDELTKYKNAFDAQINTLMTLQRKIEALVEDEIENFFKSQLKNIWQSVSVRFSKIIQDGLNKEYEDSTIKKKYERFFGENNIFDLLITLINNINLFEQNYKDNINYQLFVSSIKNLGDKLVGEIANETSESFRPNKFKNYQYIVIKANELLDAYNKNVNDNEETRLLKLAALKKFKKQTLDFSPVINFLRVVGSVVLSAIVTVLFSASAAFCLPFACLSCNGKLCGEVFSMVSNAILYGPKLFNIPSLSTFRAYSIFQRTPVDKSVQAAIKAGNKALVVSVNHGFQRFN